MRRNTVTAFLILVTLAASSPVIGQDVVTLGDAPAASLVIPYFASTLNGSDLTTLFSITNVGDAPAIAHVTLWTQAWQPTLTFDLVLAAHDIQPVNVASLLNGSIPVTAPRGLPGCIEYAVPALSAGASARLLDDHTGRTCMGELDDSVATGFITVDVVHQCTPLSSRAYDDPLAMSAISPGYFASGGSGIASNANQLVGDFHLLNRAQDFAQGGTPLHLRADVDMFSEPLSFYSFITGGSDNRAPLGDTIYGRFLNGGLFDGGTDMLIFRVPSQYVPPSELACGQSPWSDADNAVNMIVLDEASQGFLSQRSFPWGTDSVQLDRWPELPPFGALELQFPGAMQGTGLVLQNANGRFSSGFDMTPIPRRRLDADEDGNPQGFRVDFEWTVVDQQVALQGQCFENHSPTPCENPQWFFGDGNTGNTVNPVHTYGQGGVYEITFIAESDGAVASRTHPVTVSEPAGGGGDLSVVFTAVQIPNTLNVQFTGSCFLDNQLVTCQEPAWDFGDGNQGTGTTPSHTFADAATFPVTFSASAGGQSDSHTVDVTLTEPGADDDELNVTFTAVQTPNTLTVRFNGSCFLNAQPVVCQNPAWTFGDGSQGTGTAPAHTFPAPGTFRVTFTAAADGQAASRTMDVTVDEPGGGDELTVTFTAVQTPNTLTVQFSGACFLNGQGVECQNPAWTFGDGSQGSGTAPAHTYPEAGSFTVTFTASVDGTTASQTSAVTVDEPGGGGNDFSVTFTALQTPETLDVQFNGTCFLDDQTVPCEDPAWTFGDGSQGTGTAPVHSYADAGTFTVAFTAASNGQSDTRTMEIVVQDPVANDDFTVAFTAVQTPDTLNVQFSGACFLDDQEVGCQDPAWTFGDGNQGSGDTPTHTYAGAGTFTVTFTAAGNGQTDAQTMDIVVEDPTADDNFTVAFTAVQTPGTLDVQFTGSCFLDDQTVACQDPEWTFGDGTQGTGTTPAHTYANAATFTVTFTASGSGQSDSQAMDIVVEDPGGNDVFEVTFTAQQVPDTLDVQFGGACSLNGQSVACQNPDWDFGDGTQTTGESPTHTFPDAGTFDVTFTASGNGQTDAETLQVVVEEPNNPPVISGLTCLPNPLIAGRVATCTFAVADSDGDDVNWKVTTDTASDTCIEDVVTNNCMQTLEGTADGDMTVPFNLLSTAGILEDAFVQVEATDERGGEAEVQGIDVVIDANDPPTFTSFACTPSIVIPGTPSACTLVFLDLNQETVDWSVTITQGTDVCLDSDPGPNCITTVQGSGDQFPLTEVVQLRTALTTPGQQVIVQATLDDGLDTVQQTFVVTIP